MYIISFTILSLSSTECKEYNGKGYIAIHSPKLKFDEAETYCAANYANGHLVSITSQAEQAFVDTFG